MTCEEIALVLEDKLTGRTKQASVHVQSCPKCQMALVEYIRRSDPAKTIERFGDLPERTADRLEQVFRTMSGSN